MEAEPNETRSSWGFEEEEILPGRVALHLLGGGRSHEVYLTWEEHLFTVVAVKILRPDRVADRRSLRDLAAEGRALASLRHPVLPRIFDAVMEGDRPHLVMEFLDGPRLSTLVRRDGPLAMEQVLPLALQLCSALHYMTAEGWVHLDVKPKNVIMGATPRLVDLSIARTLDEARDTAPPIGTDPYMAPEQCRRSEDPIGPPADVWGLGVTVYEALTGRLPFPRGDRAGSPEERFPQLVVDPQPLPREVPEAVAAPVMATLKRRAPDRPSPAELGRTLQPLVDALPRRPVLPRLRPRPRSFRRRA